MSIHLKGFFDRLQRSTAFVAEAQAWKQTWHIIVPGQMIRLAKFDGQYIFPELARNHLSNLADGFMVAGSANMLQMGLCEIFGKQVKSRPTLSAAFGLAVLGVQEYLTTYPPHHDFDWVDMGLHVGSTLAYLAYHHRDKIFPKTLSLAPRNDKL
jgi:hypothetical protein